MKSITMKDLLKAGVHFGHLTRFRCPKMQEYIFGVHNGINIINLEKTLPLYKTALKFVNKVISNGGKVLFVATKHQARDIIAEAAESCDMPYVNHRWLGGMLTNYKTIKQSIRRLNELKKMTEDGTLEHLTKKEGLTVLRELEKLQLSLGGIKEMGSLPDALFIIDVGMEKIAVKEANRLKIPVIGVVDTNCDPTGLDYVIPGNDDALRSIQLYANSMADTINEVKENKKTGGSKFEDEFVEAEDDIEE